MQVPLQDNNGPPLAGAGPASPLLQGHSLQCVKNDTVLFRDLDLELGGGEILHIDGANGSGKTSLIRIICGLSPAEEGQVSWCGRDIHSHRTDYLRNLVYVGHANGIKNDLTLLENLAVVQALCARTADRTLEQVLSEMSLLVYADSPAANLSSGQRRRLALARLLIADARLWVLDEPFNSLDEGSRQLVRGVITEHVRKDGCVVLTAHELVDWKDLPVKRIAL